MATNGEKIEAAGKWLGRIALVAIAGILIWPYAQPLRIPHAAPAALPVIQAALPKLPPAAPSKLEPAKLEPAKLEPIALPAPAKALPAKAGILRGDTPASITAALALLDSDRVAGVAADQETAAAQLATAKALADKSQAVAAYAADYKAFQQLLESIYGPVPTPPAPPVVVPPVVVPPVTPPVVPPVTPPPAPSGLSILVVSIANCLPCQQQVPIVAQAKAAGIAISETIVMDNASYGTIAYPTLIMYRDGKEVARRLGVQPLANIQQWVADMKGAR